MSDRPLSTQRIGWTLAGLTAAIAPHALHVPPWVIGIAAGLVTWRLAAELRGWRLPSQWVKLVLAAIGVIAVAGSFRTLNGLDAGTSLLVLMAAMKLTETRVPRDHVVLVFIGWFLCLAAFLYEQNLLIAAWVIPAAWLLAAALLHVSRPASIGPPLKPFRATGGMLLKTLPLALALFVFFPRLQSHFWGLPASERAMTGLDEEMAPGDISELTLNDQVAFRVTFNGDLPPRLQRYFRGPVLSETDGYTWRRSQASYFQTQPVQFQGAPIDYRVVLQPHHRRWIFAMDMAGDWPERDVRQSWNYLLWTRNPITSVYAYEARSYPRYTTRATLPLSVRRHELQLPERRNQRAVALGRELRAGAADDRAVIKAALDRFRNDGFTYTLTPPTLARDAVDDFLFNTKAGFCGHYAAAFTTLMRAAGIPARVVTGYQGGDYNPIGGYLIVRQSHAHAWSEVWLEDRGWTRVDPTAAIAPERVERGLEFALPESEPVPGRLLRQSDLLWRARLTWDTVNARWNDWVVEFDAERQLSVLSRLGLPDADWKALGLMLAITAGGSLLLIAGWFAWEYRPLRRDPASVAYARFTRRLAARGVERRPHETPHDFLARVRQLRPDLVEPARRITDLYVALRYGAGPDPSQLRELVRQVSRFRA